MLSEEWIAGIGFKELKSGEKLRFGFRGQFTVLFPECLIGVNRHQIPDHA